MSTCSFNTRGLGAECHTLWIGEGAKRSDRGSPNIAFQQVPDNLRYGLTRDV